jgi:hypothetical protein
MVRRIPRIGPTLHLNLHLIRYEFSWFFCCWFYFFVCLIVSSSFPPLILYMEVSCSHIPWLKGLSQPPATPDLPSTSSFSSGLKTTQVCSPVISLYKFTMQFILSDYKAPNKHITFSECGHVEYIECRYQKNAFLVNLVNTFYCQVLHHDCTTYPTDVLH